LEETHAFFCRPIFGYGKLSQHLPHISLSLSVLFLTDTDGVVKLTRERVEPKKTTEKKCGPLPMDSLYTLQSIFWVQVPPSIVLLFCPVLYCVLQYVLSTVQNCCTVLTCNARNALYYGITALRCCALQYYTALHCTVLYCSDTSCTVF
jgi:hypothetical protein